MFILITSDQIGDLMVPVRFTFKVKYEQVEVGHGKFIKYDRIIVETKLRLLPGTFYALSN